MFLIFFFFFKQKTAYELRISDWSSDVCSSDLDCRKNAYSSVKRTMLRAANSQRQAPEVTACGVIHAAATPPSRRRRQAPARGQARPRRRPGQIGRASCRERVGQYV